MFAPSKSKWFQGQQPKEQSDCKYMDSFSQRRDLHASSGPLRAHAHARAPHTHTHTPLHFCIHGHKTLSVTPEPLSSRDLLPPGRSLITLAPPSGPAGSPAVISPVLPAGAIAFPRLPGRSPASTACSWGGASECVRGAALLTGQFILDRTAC